METHKVTTTKGVMIKIYTLSSDICKLHTRSEKNITLVYLDRPRDADKKDNDDMQIIILPHVKYMYRHHQFFSLTFFWQINKGKKCISPPPPRSHE